MRDVPIYDEWEPAPSLRPQCSYLYSLAPIGVGTAAVESLTGYITRLAAAHAVETGALVNYELFPRVPCTKGASMGCVPSKMPTSFFIEAFPLNGIGERVGAWVGVLEQMTCMRGLDLLTLLPWSKMISCVHLLRAQRAWCPFCYGMPSSTTDPCVYDRLLWNFQVVTACPIHRCLLESICPLCNQTQYVFAPRMRPGYCSRCQCWLGRPDQSSGGDRSESVRIAEMAGELLAASPLLPRGFGLDQFRENMRTFRRYRRFDHVFQRRNIRGWMNAGNAPRMDSLALLSIRQNASMLCLLTERIVMESPLPSQNPHAHYRIAAQAVGDALESALREHVPPSLAEIAARLGYRNIQPLHLRFPGLCQQIVLKRRANLQPCVLPHSVPLKREQIERALSEALNQSGPVSLSSLAAAIGLHNKRRLYKGFHDLRKAVVANNQRFRRQRVKAIEGALRAALREVPVPSVTAVAGRLGLKTVSTLTRRFPDLSAELKRRRRAV